MGLTTISNEGSRMLSDTTRCGVVATELMELLSLAPFNPHTAEWIKLNDVLNHLISGHVVSVEISPISGDFEAEGHVFVCLKYKETYYVLDSYYMKKRMEIRSMSQDEFHQFWSLISNHPTLQQWIEMAHVTPSPDMKIYYEYRFSIESRMLNPDRFIHLLIQTREGGGDKINDFHENDVFCGNNQK